MSDPILSVESPAATAAAPRSVSVTVKPQDSRCRYWAKVLRERDLLPVPSTVDGANSIPVPFLRKGDEELFFGDVLIEGEENHHKKARGWFYRVSFMHEGELVRVLPSSAVKAAMKAAGLAPQLLAGSGEVAACVRIAHGLRAGFAEQILAAD